MSIDHIKNKVIREELQVFNLNERLKDYKQQWKEHLEKMCIRDRLYNLEGFVIY